MRVRVLLFGSVREAVGEKQLDVALESFAAAEKLLGGDPARRVEVVSRRGQTLEAMGKVDEFQDKIFVAIHKQRQPIMGDAAILDWAGKQPGLDGQKFAEMYRSFTVSGKIKRATQLTNDYQVGGVPALGVAGRYYVDGELARSLDRALQITEYLIGQAAKA